MFIPPFIRQFLKNRTMRRFYQPFIRQGSICFDIGANHGDRTAIFRSLGARVICVEPQSTCIELLRKRFKGDPKVEIIHAAVGAEDGMATLQLCDETDACATLAEGFVQAYGERSGLHWSRSETVHMVTLNSLVRNYGVPDFCKVDTEGYESAVFHGLDQPLPCISFEFNDRLLDDTALALKILGKLGPYQCNFLRYEYMKLVLDRWMPLGVFSSNLPDVIGRQVKTGEVVVRML